MLLCCTRGAFSSEATSNTTQQSEWIALPTCALESCRNILSFAASGRLRVASAGVTGAYSQAKEAWSTTSSNLHNRYQTAWKEHNVVAHYSIVPIYGQADVGRGLWLHIKDEARRRGWQHSVATLVRVSQALLLQGRGVR